MSTHEKMERPSFLLGGVLRRILGLRRSPHVPAQRSEEEIQEWILVRLAEKLEMDAAEFDVRVPFADYGLDSRSAVSLSGELEDWLGLELPPTLVWEHPTVSAIATFLAKESAAKFGPPSSAFPQG